MVCHGRVPPGPLHWCPPVSPLTFWALSCKSGCTWSCRESPEPSPAFLGGGGREVSPPSKLPPPPPPKMGAAMWGTGGVGVPPVPAEATGDLSSQDPHIAQGVLQGLLQPPELYPQGLGGGKGGKAPGGGSRVGHRWASPNVGAVKDGDPQSPNAPPHLTPRTPTPRPQPHPALPSRPTWKPLRATKRRRMSLVPSKMRKMRRSRSTRSTPLSCGAGLGFGGVPTTRGAPHNLWGSPTTQESHSPA